MPRVPTFAAALALVASAAACQGKMDVPADAQLSCGSASDCPSGLVCHRGRCANPAALDTTPPDLAGAVTVTPARVRAGQSFTLSLRVSEPLDAPPAVTLGLVPPPPFTCAQTAGLSYACSYAATGHENGNLGGDIAIDVRLRDLASNDTLRSSVGTVTLDFAPPSPTIASVGYTPGPGNPLAVVQRATRGTVVHVAVSADEALSTASPPSLVARLGGTEIPFAYVPGVPGDPDVVFVTTLAGTEPDGDYALQVAWSDAVGNPGAGTLPREIVKVKTSAPTLVVDQNALVFVRSPLGNASDENLGSYTIPAGPYFALEPSDALTTSPTLPQGSLTLAGGALPSAVIAQSAGTGKPAILGTLLLETGRLPRQALVSPDIVGVWLSGVDDAGNRSAPVKLQTSEWVATPNPPAFGASPHQLEWTGYASSTSEQQDGFHPVTTPEATGTDPQAVLARAEAAWRDRTTSSSPVLRRDHAIAYDSARGRVVLFGGYLDAPLGDTWEWNGSAWAQAAATGPGARSGHAMAYDSARGRVVLFGGAGAGDLRDTWEWNGSAWTQVATTGPSARRGHAMAYDSARGRVVLFGGSLGDTWEWNGSAWLEVATTGPSARRGHAMAYDSARGRVVLFGGSSSAGVFRSDTWEWNGSAWANVATTGPSARSSRAMAYDSARHRVVLFGGSSSTGFFLFDTWEWNGSAWTQVATTGPTGGGYAMAYDSARSRVVVAGGDTWEWSGSAWTAVATTNLGPGARDRHAMAYDGGRGRVVLFGGDSDGGDLGDTWEWNGSVWMQVATTGPSARYWHAMAYDSARGRVVLFGGRVGTDSVGDTWEWNGSAWTQVATTGPSPRWFHAMAYDGARGRVVLFGGTGAGGGPTFGDTWEWNGGAWTQVATTGPSARLRHAMAYDGSRGRVVLFGGGVSSSFWSDTWEWSGSAWTQVATTGPSARGWHAMAYDGARGRVVLFGGSSSTGLSSSETWEWNGSAWAQVATTGPSARSGPAMAYDGARGRVVLFGGYASLGRVADTWEYDATPAHQPAVQLNVSSIQAGFASSAITSLRVRAFGGGAYDPGDASAVGATLLGWSNGYALNGAAGEWLTLAANATPAAAQVPYLPAAPASLVDWSSSSPAEARRFVVDRDGRLSFQLRPAGPAGLAPGGSRAALDYIEVRIRYAVP